MLWNTSLQITKKYAHMHSIVNKEKQALVTLPRVTTDSLHYVKNSWFYYYFFCK